MIDSEFDNLQDILLSMPELRQLDTQKNSIGLTRSEHERWMMLYRRMIRLFGEQFEELAEQRRSLRIPMRVKVDFDIQNEKFHSMSHDISINGIAIDFTHVIPLGAIAKMNVGIEFPTFFGLWRKKHIPLKGQVRWISKEANRIGFQFVGLSPQNQEIIQEAIYTALNKKVVHAIEAYKQHVLQ